MQVVKFYFYGICKLICLLSFMYNRFHKELRFFFSLLKRKKEAKKEKSSRCTCTVRFQYHTRITRENCHHRFSPTKLPRRGIQAAAAAVTLPFSLLKLGRKVSGDPPLSLLKRKKEAKKKRVRVALVLHYKCIIRRLYREFSAYAKSFIFMWKPLHPFQGRIFCLVNFRQQNSPRKSHR